MIFAIYSSRCKKRSSRNLSCSTNHSQFTATWINFQTFWILDKIQSLDLEAAHNRAGADYTLLPSLVSTRLSQSPTIRMRILPMDEMPKFNGPSGIKIQPRQ